MALDTLKGIRIAASYFVGRGQARGDDDTFETISCSSSNVSSIKWRASDGRLGVEFNRPNGTQGYIWDDFPQETWEEMKEYADSGIGGWIQDNLCQGAAGTGGSPGAQWWVDDYEGALSREFSERAGKGWFT